MRFSKWVLFFALSLLDYWVIFLTTKKISSLGNSSGVRYPLCMWVIYSFSHLLRDDEGPEPGQTKGTWPLLQGVSSPLGYYRKVWWEDLIELGEFFLRNWCSSGELSENQELEEEVMGKVPDRANCVHEDPEVFETWHLWTERKMHTVGLWRVKWMVRWRGKQGLFLVQLPKLSLGLRIFPKVIKAGKWHG